MHAVCMPVQYILFRLYRAIIPYIVHMYVCIQVRYRTQGGRGGGYHTVLSTHLCTYTGTVQDPGG